MELAGAESAEDDPHGLERDQEVEPVRDVLDVVEIVAKLGTDRIEIGDMALPAQAKMLRALQERVIQRVGGDKNIKVDVRVLAATNKDLQKEIAEGRFREDLFHRINVIPIHVPRLSERSGDVPELVEHFLGGVADELGVAPPKFSKDALQALSKAPWTGNIRELRNVVERLVILCGDEVTGQDVKRHVSGV